MQPQGSRVPSLTIRGIPEELLERLRRSAAENQRSLNGEVLHRLERSVAPEPVDPAAFLARARARNAREPVPPLTDALLRRATEEDRP